MTFTWAGGVFVTLVVLHTEGALHLRHITHRGVTNVRRELISNTTTLVEVLLQQAVDLTHGFGVRVVLHYGSMLFLTVRSEGVGETFRHHFFDVDVRCHP